MLLQVLLPAKTSTLYGNLLAAEVEELGKGQTTSWDRIKEIRRLKERMIHKCERLARASVTDRNATPMITLYAPPEFRLREMEKWLKQQSVDHGLQNFSCCSMCGPLGPQDSRPTLSRKASSRSTSVIATRTAITTQGSTTTWIAPSYPSARSVAAPVSNHIVSARATRFNRVPERVPKLPGGSSSQTYIEPDPAVVHSQPKKPEPNHQPSRTAQRSNSLRSREGLHVPNATRQPGSPPTKRPLESTEQPRHAPPSREAVTEAHALPNKSLKEPIEQQRRSPKHEPILLAVHPRALMKSPDPLPIPHRPRGHQEDVARNTNESAVADHSAPASEVASEQEPLIIPDPASRRVEPPEETPEEEPTPFPSTGQILETIHEKPEESEVCAARPLIRRRSSLKNKTSMSKLSVGSQSKSVTWAMDRAWTQQMAEIVKNTNEAEVIGVFSTTNECVIRSVDTMFFRSI